MPANRPLRLLLLPALLVGLLLTPVFVQAQSMPLSSQMTLLLDWLPGEYDNHEQVWRQREDGVARGDLLQHMHHRFVPVTAPALGDSVFFVLQTLDDDLDKVHRQAIYVFKEDPAEQAIKLTIYQMVDESRYRNSWQQPELLTHIGMHEVSAVPGCELYWRFNGEFFDGVMKEGACHFYSESEGVELFVSDTLRLTDTEIQIMETATDADGNFIYGPHEPHRNRKVRQFSGWMGVKQHYVNRDYIGDDMLFSSGFTIHNEGQIVPLLDDDGEPTGYSIQLAQLTYQNTRTPILKLGVIEDDTGETLSYAWASIDANRIGMNLGWFEAGLTAIAP